MQPPFRGIPNHQLYGRFIFSTTVEKMWEFFVNFQGRPGSVALGDVWDRIKEQLAQKLTQAPTQTGSPEASYFPFLTVELTVRCSGRNHRAVDSSRNMRSRSGQPSRI